MGLDVMYAKLAHRASLRRHYHDVTAAIGGATTAATSTTGSSASACIAISIPDRVAAI